MSAGGCTFSGKEGSLPRKTGGVCMHAYMQTESWEGDTWEPPRKTALSFRV